MNVRLHVVMAEHPDDERGGPFRCFSKPLRGKYVRIATS